MPVVMRRSRQHGGGGGIPTDPFNLQTLINNATAGTTLTIPLGIYRQSATVNKALTVNCAVGTEIRGSDVWTGWSGTGPWTHTGLPSWSSSAICYPGTGNVCQVRYQVYVDGAPQSYVAGTTPASGQFGVSGTTLYLGTNPAGHTVEVTTRTGWLSITAANVTLDGLVCRHAGMDQQGGGIESNSATVTNITVKNCKVYYAHGRGISIAAPGPTRTTSIVIDNNEAAYCGSCGITNSYVDGLTFTNNYLHDNNASNFDGGYEAGGYKCAFVQNATYQGNTSNANVQSHGLWWDGECVNITIAHNECDDNGRAGVHLETVNTAVVRDNVFKRNGAVVPDFYFGSGVLSHNSHDVQVYDNYCEDNADGINGVEEDRVEKADGYYLKNNTFRDNTIRMAGTAVEDWAMGWFASSGTTYGPVGNIYDPASGNTGESNGFVYSVGENGNPRWMYGTTNTQQNYSAMTSWQGTPGGRYAFYGDNRIPRTLAWISTVHPGFLLAELRGDGANAAARYWTES